MRKIKNKERLNGMKYCNFCRPEKVIAIWKENFTTRLACEIHKTRIEDLNDCDSEAEFELFYRSKLKESKKYEN